MKSSTARCCFTGVVLAESNHNLAFSVHPWVYKDGRGPAVNFRVLAYGKTHRKFRRGPVSLSTLTVPAHGFRFLFLLHWCAVLC